ncbi:MAG TPA: TrkA family potassium uptake protein [Candidatus Saccharimonadales bacterium]|nr:TrkA family potassium uptake protein [Candidatus Saccharimonadales bacterium]
MSTNQTPWRILLAAIGLLIVGSVGFMQFQHISFGNALYEALLLLLTHYDHIDATDLASRIITIALAVGSYILLGYLLKWFAEYMIGVGDNVRKRRLHAKVNKLKDHYIVCGLGRVGSQIAREMALEKVPFVGMDRDQTKVGDSVGAGYLAFQADSADETALQDAGIEHAAGLVACLGEDSANLLVTLAARALNPNIYIVARANRADNEVKLKRAGADRVALPYQIGGYHMASMALRPSVVDYMDVVSSSGTTTNLQVEEMVVGEHSRLAGHHLGKALVEGEIGATVIAINGSDGTSRVRPSGNEVIYAGDRLIVLGAKPDLTKASDLVR